MMSLREKLSGTGRVFGTHIALNEPCITEIVASLDFDFVWIDTEHSAIDYHMLLTHLIAARAGGTPAVVRVPWNNPVLVKRVLEQGPDGIVFPLVNTPDEVNAAMASCLYPPDGTRGFGPVRAVRYNLDDVDAYIQNGHKSLVRLVQIESEQAIDNLEAILENPYVDGLIIGACDLSGSIGELGHIYGMRTLSLIDRAVVIAGRHNIPIGISTSATDADTLTFWADRGMRIIASGVDYDFILRGAQATLKNLQNLDEGM